MTYDFLIIGAGISGAAVGYELSSCASVVILEAESSAGYHSTGRSAAIYTPNYGSSLVRKINHLSALFLESPPESFTEQSLLTHRGMLNVFSSGHESALESLMQEGGDYLQRLGVDEVMLKSPFLIPERIVGAAYEHGVFDMDVAALHQGFLHSYKKRGGSVFYGQRVTALQKQGPNWLVQAAGEQYQAKQVVNAAGAWADEIARLAGASEIGLVPKRRTAILVEPPDGIDPAGIPAIDFYPASNYIKPEINRIMVSPGDETPVSAQDIQPEDFDIAVLIDWMERESTLRAESVEHRWAGLRSFVADGNPVVGPDPIADGFFWLAAQGGYGIMMSSALGRAAAALLVEKKLPADFIDAGICEQDVGVGRLRP